MKKGFLFSILAVLAAATIANAAPRFGVIAKTSGTNNGANFGAIITDDMFNASLLLGNQSNDTAFDPSVLTLNINANYKVAIDTATALKLVLVTQVFLVKLVKVQNMMVQVQFL